MYDSHIWHPYTRFSARPDIPVIERAEGIYLHTAAGEKLFDAISSWWCVNLGHGHPRIVEAIQRQSAILQHSILGNLSHPGAVELSRRLVQRCPTPDRHVVFASDGASAIEAGLRVAVQYFHNIGQPQRHRFIALKDPYHGDTMGAVSVGFMPTFHRPLKPLTFEVHHLPTPGRTDCKPSLHHLKSLLETHGDTIAALVLESLCQGASGMKMYCPGFIARAAALCRQHGVLLILDEIAMGLGRTGTFFAFEQALAHDPDLNPDIICIGKGITNGALPLSAAIVRDELYETFTDAGSTDHTFFHGHTFAGNPIACAAALATLDVYDEDDILVTIRSKAEILAAEFETFRDHPHVRDVRCLGLVAAIELESTDLAVRLRDELRAKGILLRPLGKVLYLMPPFITPDDVLRDSCAALREGLSSGSLSPSLRDS